jgi:phosphoglycolate phosphatase-like HAD superfamily hydrolase
MTHSSSREPAAIWLRPGLTLTTFLADASASHGQPPELDTALFDVDGVLIDTHRSYRLAVMHGAEHLVRVTNGLAEAPSPMVSQEDVAAFKRAGGFNSDWDATQLFAALWTARLREWRGGLEAAIPLAAWAERAGAAARERRGGVTWLRETVPASAIPDEEVARWAHDEFYWGTALARELYGHEPAYAPDAPGFVHNEEMLLERTVLPELRGLGVAHFGLITGRVGPEVDWAVRRIAASCGLDEGTPPDGVAWFESTHGRSPFGAIVPATVFAKPDPRALAHAITCLGSHAALFVGDTADDLDLVLRYRVELRSQDACLPPVLAVSIASGLEAETYSERGADIVLPHVRLLPEALQLLGAQAA